ncbi:inositol oxygenase [Apiosordaria backusii]|uniref:Inositol oxygenase n=1 Tax=Apiosordaria backusii TaxID=314023 RepID=A0AA40AIE1_9PEZI|nr:inositol oxygenase [Apiosordaria backusii]
MAHSAIYASEQPSLLLADGAALEAISDAIDTVNKLKGLSSPITAYDSESRFDLAKDKGSFRQYETACERVRNFYSEQHAQQTVEHNLRMRARFFDPKRKREEMTIWQAMERLNTLIDDSDPDTELSQIQHLLQSAEAIRRDGKPRWMQVTGLVHDLGKLMLFFEGCSTGQWDVVGDTFPVGCKWDEKCVFVEAFEQNPDAKHPVYGTKNGIYTPGKGIDQFLMSWGHDEFLYLVLKDQSVLPREALAMIRYHSFYPWHHEGGYKEFMADGDDVLLNAVQAFNPYDLYSKTDEEPDVEKLKPYYMELIDEFFPQKILKW